MTLSRLFKALCFAALPLAGAGCVGKAPDTQTAAVAAPEARAPALEAQSENGTPPQQSVMSAAPVASVPQEAASTQVMDTSAPLEAANPRTPLVHDMHALQASVQVLCEQIGNKLSSVSIEDCAGQQLTFGGGLSVHQRPLVIKEHRPAGGDGNFRVLIMGGMHGDEYSSISILFKWLALFSPASAEGAFHWRFAPLVNPDGLLDGGQAKRQNANGVDLNRNFPSRDWNDTAARYWQESTGSNPRRFPGESAASEPEVQWVVQQIEEFQPDVIVSVHAPYHLLDFDGPAEAPAQIGELYLHQLGVYPGSLGNFAGLNRQIPVVTLELPSAGIMPPAEQIDLMWKDLVAWLDREGRKGLGHL
jgi:protein MpaA